MGIATNILACVALTGFTHILCRTINIDGDLQNSAQQSAAPLYCLRIRNAATALASLVLSSGNPTAGWQAARHNPGLASCRQLPQTGTRIGWRLAGRRNPLMQLTKEGIATGKAGVELVKGKDLGLTYDGDRYLFEGVTVGVAQGLKLALVGPNGEGKSSLMKVLAGIEKPQKGTVESLSKLTVAYVEQEPSLHPGQKAVEFFLNPPAVSHPVEGVKAFFEYREAELQAERADVNDEKASARLLRAVSKMDETHGWSLESHIQRLFVGLRVDSLLDRDASTLSGGERKRVALAAAFVHQPTLLLLDEPTNHLDIDAIQWLENEISSRPDLTALIVTHDRAFLEGACQEILELDRSQIFRHRGTWEGFLEAKQQRIEQEETINTATRDKLKQELAWARSACKARATKSEWRLQNMEEMAAKLKEADLRMWKSKSSFKFESSVQRLGTSSVSFQKACLTIPSKPPRPVLDNFNFDLGRSQHVGIIGGNGVGKSTFLKAMQGLLPLDSGKLEIGKNVVFGYVSQAGLELQEDVTIFEFLRQAVGASPAYGNQGGQAIEDRCNYLMEQFGFYTSHDPRTARVKSLSGGELRRLQLIEVLAREPNFLILDEPTNDLDLNSIAALEEFLQEFKGVLILVSHDRYFLDQVCEGFLVLDGTGNVELWEDSAAEYLEYRSAQLRAKEQTEFRAQQKARRLAEKESERPKTSGRDALSDLLAQFDAETETASELSEVMEGIGTSESRLARQSSGDEGSGRRLTEDCGEFESKILPPLAGGIGRSRERLDGGSLGASSLPGGHGSGVYSSGPAGDIFKKYSVPQKGGSNAQRPRPPDLDSLRKKPTNKEVAPDLDALRQKLLQQVKK